MSDSQEWGDERADEHAADDIGQERGFDTMLFDGDQGTLPLPARKALVAVVKNSYVSAEQEPNTWAVLLAHRVDIESRLNDMFLVLIVDKNAGIAYKQQAPGDRFTTLLPRDTSYSLDETILLRNLREIYSNERGLSGESVFVYRDDMIARILADAPQTQTDLVRARRSAENAFENVRTSRILLKTNDPERWQISPVIEPLLPVEKLRDLQEWLRTSAADEPAEPNIETVNDNTTALETS
ncbi:DUF4194 domain-containing protein [Mycobacterium sp. IS-3022]|uniref:DUF4194 domain-containing protein n=1 Tax=Mycobacterium sp. IS-3022 TaxID=1772277 RepID=UPI0007417EFB|nr:DUF4194 domain-containing protein [Mycobacterium sp. IS-3022]KUI02633.1 hypothetical protein AU188_14590 [Mycobacterium sp. IS-3022]